MSTLYLEQLLLPYYDVFTQEYGWQFGLPVDRRGLRGLSQRLATQADVSILVLLTDGSVRTYRHPLLRIPSEAEQATGRPYLPSWAWIPVDTEEGIQYARVVAPEQGAGSMPVADLPSRPIPTLGRSVRGTLTPMGLAATGLEPTPFDLPLDIPLSLSLIEDEPAWVEKRVLLGGVPICHFYQHDGQVMLIEPQLWARTQQLWTSHLYRIVKLFCAP